MRFESVCSKATRADRELAVCGRTIERVDAHGKHLLISFSGAVVLHTHMRLHGVWHLYRDPSFSALGPDLLKEPFEADEAARRIQSLPEVAIADALLDQHAIAGIGNILKCEALSALGLDSFARVADLSSEDIARVIDKGRGA